MQYVINANRYTPVKIMFKDTCLKSFDSFYGLILWCCIKQRCITQQQQHFDDDIANISIHYNMHGIHTDYMEYRDNIHPTIRRFVQTNYRIDDSFLLMMHGFLIKPETFTFRIGDSDEIYNLTLKALKLFKPEKYI